MEKAQFAIGHEPDSQRVAIPARALAQKAYRGGWAVGFRPGLRREPDRIAEAAQPQAKLEILSRADVESALPQEYLAPVHGTGAGQARDRVGHVQHGLAGADRHQVLDSLQAGPQRLALVADCNIAGRAADVRIAESGCDPRDSGRLKDGVRI